MSEKCYNIKVKIEKILQEKYLKIGRYPKYLKISELNNNKFFF